MKNIIKAKDDEIAQLKLNGIDKPSGGGNGGTEVNAESFAKMTLDERIALKLKTLNCTNNYQEDKKG